MINKYFLKTVLIAFILSVSLGGCALLPKKTAQKINNKQPNTYQATKIPTKNIAEELATQNKIVKFNNYNELKEFLEQNQTSGNYGYGMDFGMAKRGVEMMATPPMAATIDATAESGLSLSESIGLGGGASTDYSQTNIQVEGVDEADIIKTDGEYIYAVVKNDLFIVDARPAEKASIVSKIAFKSRPQDIYINENRLAVYGQEEQIYDIMPYESFRRQSQYTFFKVFDISDKKNPTQIRDLEFEGNYSNSRMIGDYVYFVTNNYNYAYISDEPIIPRIMEGGVAMEIDCVSAKNCFMPDVYYFDIPYNSYNFTSVNAINVKNTNEPIDGDVYILNSNQNMYVSPDNIYITYTKYINEYQLVMEVTKEIVYPRLSQNDKDKINAIENTANFILSKDEKLNKITMIIERYIGSLKIEDQDNLQKEITEATKKKYADISKELEKTVIHKIGINKGKLEYKTFGEVTGYVLNQFSMDENNGYFRIATTKNANWSQFTDNNQIKSYSNLYVLDENLKQVGAVEKLAEGEQIYSVRFMQDRAYMVTFRQTDPLFVIDLKNPTNPKVLGKLKIPGFSNYLHPYNDNILIGLGKDTAENEWGGVITKGLKLSLFDVSNVSEPKEIDTYVLGDMGSDSIALYDHKAFLFSREKNLLAIPVSLRKSLINNSWGDLSFSGTIVMTITEKGFELKGKIDHSDGGIPAEMDYWRGYNYYDNNVQRNLYIDDILYSFSNHYLKMNKLSDLKEVNSLRLKLNSHDDFEVITGSTGGGTIKPVPLPMMIR